MAIDKELEKQGFEYSDREAPAEIWTNKKGCLVSVFNGLALSGDIMNFETQQLEMVLLDKVSKEKMAKVLVVLIKIK